MSCAQILYILWKRTLCMFIPVDRKWDTIALRIHVSQWLFFFSLTTPNEDIFVGWNLWRTYITTKWIHIYLAPRSTHNDTTHTRAKDVYSGRFPVSSIVIIICSSFFLHKFPFVLNYIVYLQSNNSYLFWLLYLMWDYAFNVHFYIVYFSIWLYSRRNIISPLLLVALVGNFPCKHNFAKEKKIAWRKKLRVVRADGNVNILWMKMARFYFCDVKAFSGQTFMGYICG